MNIIQSLSEVGSLNEAHSTLHQFFSHYEDDAAQEQLWFMLVHCLKSDNEEISPRHRSDMIFFYEQCVALFKAAAVLKNTAESADEAGATN